MEIEVRAFLDDVTATKRALERLGAKFVKIVQIIDYWYCPKEARTFDEIQMRAPGSYSLRVRVEEHDGKQRCELNCKALEREDDHNAFIEHETVIKDPDEARRILEHIGFKNYCTVDKRRTVYQLGEVLLNIEEIADYRPAIELEVICEKNDDAQKERLKALIRELGIPEENLIQRSITNIYMREKAFRQ